MSFRFADEDPIIGCYDNSHATEENYYKGLTFIFDEKDSRFNGWGSKFSQKLRFRVILDEIYQDLLLRGETTKDPKNILDIGCGSQDLAKVLPKSWNYLGIDKRDGLGNTDFLTCDINSILSSYSFNQVDYSVSSGACAFLEVPEVEKFVDKMVSISKLGAVFNLLDAKSDYLGSDRVVHVQYKRFFSFIFNKYDVEKNYRVISRRDYMPNEDFTIGIFKSQL